jgi:L-ascorbate metabolism protein UlaG (beta-lactamase superfamily)
MRATVLHNVHNAMLNRRRFLIALGLAASASATLVAQDSTTRRSRWEMIASDEPILRPEHKPEPFLWDESTITAAWLGHSTVLVNFYGMRIITDPVFSDRIGLNVAGLFTLGPKRLVYPALSMSELPPIDLILLSHAHMDHLDIPSLEQLDRSIPVVMAKNTYDVIQDLDFNNVRELDWTEFTFVGDLRIEAIEVKHFGWRYPWEPDRSRGYHDGRSYNAYLLSRNGQHILFGGDTSYTDQFRSIGDRLDHVELAIMPIGAYDPWIRNHASPEQAVAMADHVRARCILPIHWRTFIQSEEPTMEPIERFNLSLAANPERAALQAIGQTWVMRDNATTQSAPASE